MNDHFIDLYDEYVHSQQPRRAFLQNLVKAAGGTAAAAAVLPLLEGTGAEAAMVEPGDSRLDTATEAFNGVGGEMKAYVAMPKGAEKLPAVVVIHENRGLTDHIRDITRRVALEGFLAVAPDMISPEGGTPSDRDKACDVLYSIKDDVITGNLIKTAQFAAGHPHSTGYVGAVGFCWGGQRTNQLAIAFPQLKAAVAYYGRQPKTGIDQIGAAMLLHYAENDKNVNAGIDDYVKALRAAGKDVTVHRYDGTRHAFNNDTRPGRYNKDAAAQAWERTIAHLKAHVK